MASPALAVAMLLLQVSFRFPVPASCSASLRRRAMSALRPACPARPEADGPACPAMAVLVWSLAETWLALRREAQEIGFATQPCVPPMAAARVQCPRQQGARPAFRLARVRRSAAAVE